MKTFNNKVFVSTLANLDQMLSLVATPAPQKKTTQGALILAFPRKKPAKASVSLRTETN